MYLGYGIMLFFVTVHYRTSHMSNDLFRFTRRDRTWQKWNNIAEPVIKLISFREI